jgi:predicted ester cyclase
MTAAAAQEAAFWGRLALPAATAAAAVDILLGAVWSDGDADAARAVLAPAYVIHHDPGDAWEGRTLDPDAYVARVRESRAPFPDQRFIVRHRAFDGETVAIAWDWTATHSGDIPGFAATGRAITMTGSTFYFTSSGKVTGHWQIADRLSVFRQLAAHQALPNG